MEQSELLQIFKDADALLQGHFLLSSSLHSSQYLQCARVLEHPQIAQRLCQTLAENFSQDKITVVIGPALGGVILAYELARALNARALFAEREAGKMSLRRGFNISKQDRVLVVEDVITTGGSVQEVIELVKASGARLAAVCALVDRSQDKIDFGTRCVSLLKIDIANYPPENCPLCQQKVKLVKPGSRH